MPAARFSSHFQRTALCHSPPRYWSSDADSGVVPPSLRRTYVSTPQRYVFLAEASDAHDLMGLPAAFLGSNRNGPVRLSAYSGRIEERADVDSLSVQLFEHPSGRAIQSTLPIATFAGQPCGSGTQFRLWTWVEYEPDGQPVPRVAVQVDRGELSEQEHQRWQELAAELKTPSNERD